MIYALHAVSLLIGVLGVASVVGSFLFGWPSIIASVSASSSCGYRRGS